MRRTQELGNFFNPSSGYCHTPLPPYQYGHHMYVYPSSIPKELYDLRHTLSQFALGVLQIGNVGCLIASLTLCLG